MEHNYWEQWVREFSKLWFASLASSKAVGLTEEQLSLSGTPETSRCVVGHPSWGGLGTIVLLEWAEGRDVANHPTMSQQQGIIKPQMSKYK